MELFAPQYYHPVFLATVALLTLVYYVQINGRSGPEMLSRKGHKALMVAYLIAFIIIVGLRPVSGKYFGDTANYARTFAEMVRNPAMFTNEEGDWLFDLMMIECSKVMGVNEFFLIVEALYIIPVFWACRRLAGKNADLMMLFCLGAFSFFSYGVNGIRNGMACSLVILSVSFIEGGWKNKLFSIFLCLLAVGFHKSTALPVLCLWASLFIRNPKPMFYFWVLSILVSLLVGNTVGDFFASLGFDDRMNNYLHEDEGDILESFSRLGFRWDFLLYSMVPIVLGWYIIFRKRVYDSTYRILLGTYIFSNAFWILVIRSSFSNRFAYLSWFIYPILLAYPFVKLPLWKHKQGRYCGFFLVGQYAFTLFMALIGK